MAGGSQDLSTPEEKKNRGRSGSRKGETKGTHRVTLTHDPEKKKKGKKT